MMISDPKSIKTASIDGRKTSASRRPVFNNLLLHIHPPSIPEKTLALSHTWGLGGMSAVLVMVLAVTGILLMLVYEPFPGQAYDSVITLQNDVAFGPFVRNIHHWSGNILVIICFLHLLRVYFTGAFHGPRRWNWIVGLGLLFLVLSSSFTGYLLPWDQSAYWSITICTGLLDYLPVVGHLLQDLILGGKEVGSATLSLFFTLHVVVMPICFFLLMPYHFWLVRKAGGVVVPRPPGSPPELSLHQVSSVPNLVTREIVTGIVLIAFVMVYSLLFNAALEGKANPGLSPNPAKAPWYFVGIQEMLMHFHPLFAAWIIPAVLVGFLMALPYFRYDSEGAGIWFLSQKGKHMGVAAALTSSVLTPLAVMTSSHFIDFTAWLPNLPGFVSNGLIPLTIIVTAFVGFTLMMKRRFKASGNEATQMVFIMLLVSFVILTLIGHKFRGPGMALVCPFFSNQ